MDFMVHTEEPGVYDQEVLDKGARIIPCLDARQPLEYAKNFFRVLRRYGPYDCVHSHVQYYSGYVLLLARIAGVPMRIAHTHTADPEHGANLRRRFYRGAMRKLIQANANAGIAVSHLAGNALIPNWKTDLRWHLIPYGVDTSRFATTIDRTQVRQELGIPSGRWVIGHVGRFVDVKNHVHMVEIAKVLCARNDNAHFLLVGAGVLRPEVEAQVAAAGLSDRFTFSGLRPDVPRVLQGAMDVFLFPSKYEGLPIALMEAQLAGLPCVASDAVTPEAALNPDMVKWMSLSQSPTAWADALQEVSRASQPREVTSEVRQRMSIEFCSSEIQQLYSQFANV
jgi:glycosyltransferase involved in cell wall biosynthesis